MNSSIKFSFPASARPLALATAILFLISLAFPITASLFKDTFVFPKWLGVLDVDLAFVLVILAFVISGVARGKVGQQTEATTYRAYRSLLLLCFILGDRITWINGLPGVVWRAWLLLYLLPEWLTVAGIPARAG